MNTIPGSTHKSDQATCDVGHACKKKQRKKERKKEE